MSTPQQSSIEMEPQLVTPRTSLDGQSTTDNAIIVTSSPHAVAQPVQVPMSLDRLAQMKEARRAMIRRYKQHDPDTMCNNQRMTCREPQRTNSLFCEVHSCAAILADGDNCPNFCSGVNNRVICARGWHSESDNDSNLKLLLQRRDERRLIEAELQALEHQQDLDNFDTFCPSLVFESANTSPVSSSRSLPSVEGEPNKSGRISTETQHTRITSQLLRPRSERQWGSPGIDVFLGASMKMGMRYVAPAPAPAPVVVSIAHACAGENKGGEGSRAASRAGSAIDKPVAGEEKEGSEPMLIPQSATGEKKEGAGLGLVSRSESVIDKPVAGEEKAMSKPMNIPQSATREKKEGSRSVIDDPPVAWVDEDSLREISESY